MALPLELGCAVLWNGQSILNAAGNSTAANNATGGLLRVNDGFDDFGLRSRNHFGSHNDPPSRGFCGDGKYTPPVFWLIRDFRNALLESLAGSTPMPFIDTSVLEVIERLPGWYGRYFHSPSMTFAHYDFKRGSSIHEHFHSQEEVYEVIEGELELTIDGVKQVARPGMVGIVPSNVRHSVKALTDGRAIIVDYPLRRDMGETRS
jgi:quercetin dioxygenase-like cupin family protein